MAPYVSFIKTHLLIIINGEVINDWKTINKDMLVEKYNKCCIKHMSDHNMSHYEKCGCW